MSEVQAQQQSPLPQVSLDVYLTGRNSSGRTMQQTRMRKPLYDRSALAAGAGWLATASQKRSQGHGQCLLNSADMAQQL